MVAALNKAIVDAGAGAAGGTSKLWITPRMPVVKKPLITACCVASVVPLSRIFCNSTVGPKGLRGLAGSPKSALMYLVAGSLPPA
jgi:hypothetical protein